MRFRQTCTASRLVRLAEGACRHFQVNVRAAHPSTRDRVANRAFCVLSVATVAVAEKATIRTKVGPGLITNKQTYGRPGRTYATSTLTHMCNAHVCHASRNARSHPAEGQSTKGRTTCPHIRYQHVDTHVRNAHVRRAARNARSDPARRAKTQKGDDSV